MARKRENSAPLIYSYYANLEDVRTVVGLLDDKENDAVELPSVFKGARYGRYSLFSVAESKEIGIGCSPCEKMTYAVLYNGVPIFVSKGILMASSIALVQAKESLDFDSKWNYSALFEEALGEISGLSEEDRKAVISKDIPLGYDSLIFNKVMAEDSDQSEMVLLIPYVWVSREFMENTAVLLDSLNDFCDFAMRRIIAVTKVFEAEIGIDPIEALDAIMQDGDRMRLNDGVLIWV